MRKLTPVPSPKNTNRERLFIVHVPDDRMALDQAFEPDDTSAPETNSVQQAYADVYTLIQATGDDALVAAFNHFVDCMAEANGGGAMDRRRLGLDAIIRRGQAQAAKAHAANALKQVADFNQRFPNAARLRNV